MSPPVETITINQVWHRNHPANKLGESPIYRASDSTLHWIDMMSSPSEVHILQIDPVSGDAVNGQFRILKVQGDYALSCLAFREGIPGSYIVGYRYGIAFLDETTGALDIVKELVEQEKRASVWCNDGAVDPQGRFWLGEVDLTALNAAVQGQAYEKPRGRLWRFDGRSGECAIMRRGIGCGNGLGWTMDGKRFFYNDSVTQVISRYDFNGTTGNLSNRKDIVNGLDNGCIKLGVLNDGMVIDQTDNIWIAMWMDHSVQVFDPEGIPLKKIVFPAKCITCPAWGGRNLDVLYVTSAQPLVEKSAAGDEGGHIFRYKDDTVRGVAKNEFIGENLEGSSIKGKL
ncbi:hypothetical protein BP5796_01608 [Coleophoma crateriformis]|uniref:SMP-30/Gluconolactonase/LRE-like region domain-containing protein n=1 Tax=Coleophoma crateriformis TaxID=565419 RepID=A0A3D8T102_9HELO|nr:hypothetical protein BP5796_01608 [Coleophoma crateriformis]